MKRRLLFTLNPWVRAYLDLLEYESTKAAWANPLSIYSPDPTRAAIASFNASLEEGAREMVKGIAALEIKLNAHLQGEGASA